LTHKPLEIAMHSSTRYFTPPFLLIALVFSPATSPAYAAPPDQVQGQGGYHIEGPATFTDTTFKVNGTDSTPGIGTDARGKISITDDPSNNDPATVQADVFCANADGNRGVLVGTVTEGPEDVVGLSLLVRFTDGGKDKDAPPDTVSWGMSSISPEDAIAAGFCATNFAEQFPINSGDFTVRDRS
jgi:hypothetical protein